MAYVHLYLSLGKVLQQSLAKVASSAVYHSCDQLYIIQWNPVQWVLDLSTSDQIPVFFSFFPQGLEAIPNPMNIVNVTHFFST